LLEIARIWINEHDTEEYMKFNLKFIASSAPEISLKLSNMGIKQFEKNTERIDLKKACGHMSQK